MRAFLLLVPVALMAQTQPPAKGSAAAPKAATPAKAATKAGPATSSPAKAKAKAPAAPVAAAAPGELTTDDQKTVYALGLSTGRSLAQFNLSAAELELFKRALMDAAAGKPAINLEDWSPKFMTFMQGRVAQATAQEKMRGKAYQDKAAVEPGATRTPSGLIYRQLADGTGASPQATDTVTVNYRGTLINGTEFDSSYKRGKPAEFPLNGVIPCWTEGVQRMRVGGKSQLVCPSAIAYGDNGNSSIPGGATLIFEVELLGIKTNLP